MIKIKKLNIWDIIGSLFFGTIKFKLDNKYWYFHKGDSDINPSYPHLHSKDNKYKMNIYTGDIYLIKQKNPFTALSDKEHKKLWMDDKFVNDVIQIRKIIFMEKINYQIYHIVILVIKD